MSLDPMAILTLFGLVFGLGSGGQVYDYGFAVGATITEERVVIGFDPQIALIVPGLYKIGRLDGIALGTTILIDDYDPRTPLAAWPWEQAWTRKVYDYERGHLEGYGHWGIAYPLQILRDPCRWDPWGWNWGCPSKLRSPDSRAYPKRYWTFSLEVMK